MYPHYLFLDFDGVLHPGNKPGLVKITPIWRPAMEKSRQELFELVWSMPMPKLSYQFELSDVGLRKICVKHQIPQW
jgi:hypothetical protein